MIDQGEAARMSHVQLETDPGRRGCECGSYVLTGQRKMPRDEAGVVPRRGCWLLPRDLTRWHLLWWTPQPLAPSLGGSETCFCWHAQKGPICQENTPTNPDRSLFAFLLTFKYVLKCLPTGSLLMARACIVNKHRVFPDFLKVSTCFSYYTVCPGLSSISIGDIYIYRSIDTF